MAHRHCRDGHTNARTSQSRGTTALSELLCRKPKRSSSGGAGGGVGIAAAWCGCTPPARKLSGAGRAGKPVELHEALERPTGWLALLQGGQLVFLREEFAQRSVRGLSLNAVQEGNSGWGIRHRPPISRDRALQFFGRSEEKGLRGRLRRDVVGRAQSRVPTGAPLPRGFFSRVPDPPCPTRLRARRRRRTGRFLRLPPRAASTRGREMALLQVSCPWLSLPLQYSLCIVA